MFRLVNMRVHMCNMLNHFKRKKSTSVHASHRTKHAAQMAELGNTHRSGLGRCQVIMGGQYVGGRATSDHLIELAGSVRFTQVAKQLKNKPHPVSVNENHSVILRVVV